MKNCGLDSRFFEFQVPLKQLSQSLFRFEFDSLNDSLVSLGFVLFEDRVKTLELDIRFNQLGFGLCQLPVFRGVRQVEVQVLAVAPARFTGANASAAYHCESGQLPLLFSPYYASGSW